MKESKVARRDLRPNRVCGPSVASSGPRLRAQLGRRRQFRVSVALTRTSQLPRVSNIGTERASVQAGGLHLLQIDLTTDSASPAELPLPPSIRRMIPAKSGYASRGREWRLRGVRPIPTPRRANRRVAAKLTRGSARSVTAQRARLPAARRQFDTGSGHAEKWQGPGGEWRQAGSGICEVGPPAAVTGRHRAEKSAARCQALRRGFLRPEFAERCFVARPD